MGAAARQGARTGDFLAGKYLLEDCLGIGGMGEVYRATNVSLGRKVAIKLLSAEYVHIEEDVLRFLREARAAAAVRHLNVVDVLDVARDDDGTPFIVQELLAGEDLEHHLKARGGKLPFDEALDIMIAVSDAVGAAHAHEVVHRDLKPANIFLARDRDKLTPKVLDFGACLFPTIAERSAKELRMLIGTPHYMAPEQIMSKSEVDARSDVWALGIILYEMLVGETPFEADSANAVLQLVKTREVPPLRERVRDAPPELEELIARCTKRDRMQRFPNASAVHEEMKRVRRRLDGEREHGAAGASSREKETPSGVLATASSARRPDASAAVAPLAMDPLPPRRLLTLSSPGSEPPDAPDPFGDAGRGARPLDALADDPDFGPGLELAAQPSSRPKPPPPAPPAARPPPPPPPKATPRPAPKPAPARAEIPEPPPASPEPAVATESSMPPVLDPRAAAAPPVRAPAAPLLPRGLDHVAAAPEVREAPSEPVATPTAPPAPVGPRPPAVLAKDFTATRAQRGGWSLATTLKFAFAIALPAVLGFIAVLLVPEIGVPVGRALRGDATLASGVLTVVALVCAALLVARSVLGAREGRDRYVYVAAGGSVLFAIVMIIVTSSASEAAELGVPASMGGLSSLVAPLAPFALALGALRRAREAWIDPYSRGEAIRAAALASAMLFLALALSPVGAVRTPIRTPKAFRLPG